MKIRFTAKQFSIWIIITSAMMACISYMVYTIIPSLAWKTVNYLFLCTTDGLCILAVFSNLKNRTLFRRTMFILVLFVIYEYCIALVTKTFIFPNIIGDVLTWPLLFMTTYLYIRNNGLNVDFRATVQFFVVVIYIVSVFCIIYRTGTSIFSVYYCVSTLPLIYLLCSKRVSIVYSIISVVLILLTVKRAAFIILVLGIGLFYIVMNNNETSSRRKIIRILFLILLAIGAVLFFQYALDHLNLKLLNRLSSLSEDGGSGRTNIWKYILFKFNSSSTNERIWGHGFHSVLYQLKPLGHARFAHNSYIETLYDYGFVGIALLIFIAVKLIMTTVKMIRIKSMLAPVMAFTIVQMLILSTVSYFFEQSVIIIPICIVWGMCFGLYERESCLPKPG